MSALGALFAKFFGKSPQFFIFARQVFFNLLLRRFAWRKGGKLALSFGKLGEEFFSGFFIIIHRLHLPGGKASEPIWGHETETKTEKFTPVNYIDRVAHSL
jgi:hypothetical protein